MTEEVEIQDTATEVAKYNLMAQEWSKDLKFGVPFYDAGGKLGIHEEAVLAYLLTVGVVFWNPLEHYGYPIAVNCNDILMWGCADWEYVKTSEDLQELMLLILDLQDSFSAVVIWTCRRKGIQPQIPVVKMLKESGTWSPEMEALPVNPDTQIDEED